MGLLCLIDQFLFLGRFFFFCRSWLLLLFQFWGIFCVIRNGFVDFLFGDCWNSCNHLKISHFFECYYVGLEERHLLVQEVILFEVPVLGNLIC